MNPTPLMAAVSAHDIDAVRQALPAAIASPEELPLSRYPRAFMHAAHVGFVEALAAMHAAFQPDSATMTKAIEDAAAANQVPALQWLCERHSPRDSKALMAATCQGNAESVQFLLPLSDPELFARALVVAVVFGHQACQDLLVPATDVIELGQKYLELMPFTGHPADREELLREAVEVIDALAIHFTPELRARLASAYADEDIPELLHQHRLDQRTALRDNMGTDCANPRSQPRL